MASRKSTSLIGDFSGTIGPVVLSSWLAVSTMRTRPKRKKGTKQSEKQEKQNDLFTLGLQFTAAALEAINIGFPKPRKARMTSLNAATSYLLSNSMVSDQDEAFIDLTEVKFSKPIKSTHCAWNTGVATSEGRKVTVSWELNPFPQKCAQLNDKVVLVFYNKNSNYFNIANGAVERSMLSYTYTAFKQEIDQEIFCYMFLTSADGKLVSETEYVGMVTVLA